MCMSMCAQICVSWGYFDKAFFTVGPLIFFCQLDDYSAGFASVLNMCMVERVRGNLWVFLDKGMNSFCVCLWICIDALLM